MALNAEKIKGIAFDAYGTLFDIASIDFLLEQIFDDRARQIAAQWRRKQLEYTWLRTLMGQYKDFYELTRDALYYALEATNTSADEAQVRELMQQYYHLDVYPEVRNALARLRGTYRLAILSNANPSLLERAVAYNGLDEWLDEIISADQIRQYKPVPGIYQLAEKELGLPAENLLFASSNTWDVAGATAYGLQTAWVQRRRSVMERLDVKPAVTAANLEELADMLLT
ncbi:MAG: haloacid dehalogenase type II [Phaeodactylibacter sp.]|nr:haloacid dehalogenase type II [Phaeodactylibacter sp.]MCB9296919.1 haloacid dehalogenase type II [Lewinellaceae bacterium]